MKCSRVRRFTTAVLALVAGAMMTTAAEGYTPRYTGFGLGGYVLNQYMLGDYADYARANLGGGLVGEYTFPLEMAFDLGASIRAEAAHVFPKKDTILDSDTDFNVTGGLWIRIPFALGGLHLAFQPELGYGVVMHNADGPKDDWYTDQLLSVSTGVRWTPWVDTLLPLEFELAPLYTVAFEKHYDCLHQLGFRLGAVWHFGKVRNGGESKKTIEATATLDVEGSELSPDGDNKNETVLLIPHVDKISKKVDAWKIVITDPRGAAFRTFEGTEKLPKEVEWDGRSDSGEKVYSRNVYKATLTVVPSEKDRAKTGMDEVVTSTDIMTGILLQEIIPDHEWKMVINTIYFDADKATFDSLSPEQSKETKDTLDSVVLKIKEHPDAVVVIEGYANNVSNTEEENVTELIPISQERADVILEELARRGIDKGIMSASGMGGAKPIAEWNDRANWWKNRRVEFVLKK